MREDAAASECTGMLLARVERPGGGRDLGNARGIMGSPAAAGPPSAPSAASSSVASGMELALSCCESFNADRLHCGTVHRQ